MRLNVAIDHTHALTTSGARQSMNPETFAAVDNYVAEFGLALKWVDRSAGIDLSGLPICVGNEILEALRRTFNVHIAYNRSAYDRQRNH